MSRAKVVIKSATVIKGQPEGFDHRGVLYVWECDGFIYNSFHWSGRYDGDEQKLAAYIDKCFKAYNLLNFTTTESQQPHVLQVVENVTGKKAMLEKEYMCVYDSNLATAVAKRKPRQLFETLVAKVLPWREMRVAEFNLWLKHVKRRLRLLDVHGPSDIQFGNTFKSGTAELVAKKGWSRVGRIIRRGALMFPGVIQFVVGDCNLDLKKGTPWMVWMEDRTSTKCVWRYDSPLIGTHGNRVIEYVGTSNI